MSMTKRQTRAPSPLNRTSARSPRSSLSSFIVVILVPGQDKHRLWTSSEFVERSAHVSERNESAWQTPPSRRSSPQDCQDPPVSGSVARDIDQPAATETPRPAYPGAMVVL